MSIGEFREIFRHEIEKHLRKLQRLALEAEAGPSPRAAHEAGLSERTAQQLEVVERMATDMSECILRRVAEDTGTPFDEVESTATSVQWQCEDLQAKLERVHAEEAACRARVAALIKAQYDAALRHREEELEKLRAADGKSSGVSTQHRDLADTIEHVRRHLAATRGAVEALDDRRVLVERVERQQRRTPPAVELALGHGAADAAEDVEDEEERMLLEAIRRDERVCKRMRHCAEASVC